jgi:hypothetical protein
MEPTKSHKRRLSGNQDQRPPKSQKTESPQSVEEVIMASEEAGPSPSQSPDFEMAPPTSTENYQMSQIGTLDTSDSAIDIPEEDLVTLKAFSSREIYRGALKYREFESMIGLFRVLFRDNRDLASRLKVSPRNLDFDSPKYKETDSDQTLRDSFFGALSIAKKEPSVETWNAVFRHRMLNLLNSCYWTSDHLPRTLPTYTRHRGAFKSGRVCTNARFVGYFSLGVL